MQLSEWVTVNNNFEPIEGETGQTFTPTQNGSYACVLTSTNPIACQETSICKDVLNLGIEENGTVDFAVYPNPSNGIFTLSFDNVNSYSSVEVLDYRGRVVFRKELNGEVKSILT